MPSGYLIGEQFANAIKKTIATVDGTPYGGGVTKIPTDFSGDFGGSSSKVFRICTATGAWAVNTSKTCQFYGSASSTSTVNVTNLLMSLPAKKDTTQSRIVTVGKDGTSWYLVSFEMTPATAVFAGVTATAIAVKSTATATVLGTAATQVLTFIDSADTKTLTYISSLSTQQLSYCNSGSAIKALTDVQASINTSDCSILITPTTANVMPFSSPQTATIVTSSNSATASVVMSSTKKTVTVLRSDGTATASVIGSTATTVVIVTTFTATFIRVD